ncbi:hypothetical protein JW926_14630 [Candidatus Sumerlaeota bacterium]|nr:hypothetical protein [Candidatus Sumerlaeota bacterium]
MNKNSFLRDFMNEPLNLIIFILGIASSIGTITCFIFLLIKEYKILLPTLIIIFYFLFILFQAILVIQLKKRCPLLLYRGCILYYRGRRNIAFGVQTIIKSFQEFVIKSGIDDTERAHQYMHSIGYESGKVFSTYFEDNILKIIQDTTGKRPTWDQVLRKWIKYDENVGFGEIILEKLQIRHGKIEGKIVLNNLFTGHNSDSPLWLHSWFAGYMEGLLNNLTIVDRSENSLNEIRFERMVDIFENINGNLCIFDVRVKSIE